MNAQALPPIASAVTAQHGIAIGIDWRLRAAQLVLLVFLLSQVLAGVLRWALGMVGLQALIYVPTLLLWVQIGWIAMSHLRDRTVSRSAILLCCLLATAGLVGLCSMPAKQVVFGAWVLTPLIYGFAAGQLAATAHPWHRFAALSILAIACIGIIVNSVTDYPWVGANFQLAGKEISGAREWHIGERQRLAGFSRSSFDAAGQIAVLAALFNAGEARRWLRGAVWGLAVTAVLLSTARGILLAMLVVAIAIECERLGWRFAVRALFAAGLLWMTLPPLFGWSVDLSQTARLQLHSAQGSYLDRLSNMWPEALQLLLDSPLPLLGRGLGGIGAAQTLFEPSRFNAADNLFVYQLVTLGGIALPLFAIAAYGAWRIAAADTGKATWHNAAALRAFALIVLWYGAVSNIVEHPVLAMLYGLLLAKCFEILRFPRIH
jgi:hypothetical protein